MEKEIKKLDKNYNPFMTDEEILLNGGEPWLRQQHKIIEQNIEEFECE